WEDDCTTAQAFFRESITRVEEVEDWAPQVQTWMICLALQALGTEAAWRGDYVTARGFGERCYALNRLHGGVLLAGLEKDFGYLAAAETYYEEYLSCCLAGNNFKVAAWTQCQLGIAAMLQNNLAIARARFEDSLLRYKEMGSAARPVRIVLAELAYYEGDLKT